jgi:long-chain acyl-CoA synthetase
MVNIDNIERLPALVQRGAEQFGDAIALVHADRPDHGMSYRELHRLAGRGAHCLRSIRTDAHNPVLLCMESDPTWAAALFSILEAGLIAIPVPADTPVQNLGAIVQTAGVKTVILGARTQPLAKDLPGCECILPDRLFRDSTEARASAPAPEIAILAFTSGSTQHPRAVELTHSNLIANLKGLLSVREATPDDAFLSILPPAHLFELTVGLLGPLACGSRVVTVGAPMPNRILDALQEHQITHALAVPALVHCLYHEILHELAEKGVIDAARIRQSAVDSARRLQIELSETDLDRIRAAVRSRIGDSFFTLAVGGAAIDPAYSFLLNALGIRVELGYGLTEAGPIVSCGFTGECPPGSVGRPLPNVEVRVDESGEILVRGPNVMNGYFNDRASTQSALRDGWLHTGDRGHLDENGFLVIDGRIKEAMVTDTGETLYPEEIEPYYRHPFFAEWCVAGLSDNGGNDAPVLFVVPASSSTGEACLQEAFKEMKALAPARLRIPRMIALDHPLPRTATGKIRRRLVAATFENPEDIL